MRRRNNRITRSGSWPRRAHLTSPSSISPFHPRISFVCSQSVPYRGCHLRRGSASRLFFVFMHSRGKPSLGESSVLSGPSQISVEVMTVHGPQSLGVLDHASNEGGRPWASRAFPAPMPPAPAQHGGRSSHRPCGCPRWRPRALLPRDPRTKLQGAPGCPEPPGLRLLLGHSPLICVSQTSQQNFKEEKKKKKKNND